MPHEGQAQDARRVHVSTPWLYTGVPQPVGAGQVTLMEGTSFCIGNAHGDFGGEGPSGLFVRDTRMLSRWQLSLAGRHLEPVRVHQDSPHSATFLSFSLGDRDSQERRLLVVRQRFIGDGMREDITLRNTGSAAVTVAMFLQVESDFSDLFEVKEGRSGDRAEVVTDVRSQAIDLSLSRAGAEFGVEVVADHDVVPASDGLRWTATIDARQSWTTTIQVVSRLRGRRLRPHHGRETIPEEAAPAQRRRQFRSNAPRLTTADQSLANALGRSIDDLATLRIFDPDRPELPVIAAGAPWFMALFGRDSLLTSMMILPFDASLALGTLTTLATHQGIRNDPATEEQPGRILHELRLGPAGTLSLGGQGAYYGTADATPLFVMAVGELLNWHPAMVTPALRRHVDRALDWMLDFGDADGDGFIEYARTTGGGLVNQGWKDSWDGINFADGTLPDPPIALVEVQAYAYAAYVARARLAEAAADEDGAAEWLARAARLKQDFNEAFWLPDRGWYAVGLDRDKTPIDALTSNVGHCLWTGIADDDHAAEIAKHLLAPQMFSDWGIRTLATTMGAYDPMSYHNGSVWPHDTALCVAGLARYGYRQEALTVALGLLDAADSFGHRLPELFGGFSRREAPVPVPYPAACSPQAWAAATPMEVLRSLIGLEPGVDGPTCTPVLSKRFLPLVLRNVSCAGGRYDVEVDVHGWQVRRTGDAAR